MFLLGSCDLLTGYINPENLVRFQEVVEEFSR